MLPTTLPVRADVDGPRPLPENNIIILQRAFLRPPVLPAMSGAADAVSQLQPRSVYTHLSILSHVCVRLARFVRLNGEWWSGVGE